MQTIKFIFVFFISILVFNYANAQCVGTSSLTVQIFEGQPSAAFTFDNTQSTNTVAFFNTSTNAATYTWDFGDNTPTSNELSPTHFYTQLGNYTVTLTVSNGCGEHTTTQTISAVGLQNPLITPKNFNIFPNPSYNGIFNIELQLKQTQNFDILVQNTTGQIIYQQNHLNSSNTPNFLQTINLQNYPKSIYFVIVKTQNYILSKKIIIQ